AAAVATMPKAAAQTNLEPAKKQDEGATAKEAGGARMNIAGISEESRLALYGDDLELYLSILRSYYMNTPAILEAWPSSQRKGFPLMR
ncbi:MAG: hypothetical protein FWE65_04105, partial [Eggerthellaceae bacterium]|nr:hypothetical protein [Eggerthellaceae bacterium]